LCDIYLWVKWAHVLSATILFGTGLGTALHFWLVYRRRDLRAIAVVAGNVVLVDWLFTATSGLVQPLSGFTLVYLGGTNPWEPWLVSSYLLFAIAALCWFPVVWLQLRLRGMARQAIGSDGPLPPLFDRYMRVWFWLGWPAFLSLIGVFAMMVTKPILW